MNSIPNHASARYVRRVVVLLGLCLAFACSDEAPEIASTSDQIEVLDAVSHPSAGAPVGVVYLRVVNPTALPERLLGAKASVAKSAALHETVANGDVMRMIHHPDGFEIPPHREVALASGGKHIMLTGLSRTLEAGESFDLELAFERAGTVHVVVPIRPRAK